MRIYLLKRVENIVTKGEIACFEQFLLLSQSFQKSSAAEASQNVYICGKELIFLKTSKGCFFRVMAHSTSEFNDLFMSKELFNAIINCKMIL